MVVSYNTLDKEQQQPPKTDVLPSDLLSVGKVAGPRRDHSDEEIGGAVGQDGQQAETALSFSDFDVRVGFIRKAFWIWLTQHLIGLFTMTLYMVILESISHPETGREWESSPFWPLFLPAFVISVWIFSIMMRSKMVWKGIPLHFVCLLAFTLSFGFCLSLIGVLFGLGCTILSAAVATTQCFYLLVYTLSTNTDFEGKGPYLFVCSTAAWNILLTIIFVAISAAAFYNPVSATIYAWGFGLFVPLYLVYSVKLIVKGKHASNKISPEKYFMAGVIFYIDIANALSGCASKKGTS